jgi:hypothetical protein
LPALLALLLCVSGALSPASADTGFDGWYQVDVILFKPRNTDLDDESWPERMPEYPADVLSVYPGEPFNLSQLEQALDTQAELPDIEGATTLSDSEFAFESLSSRSRNRRIVEAATGTNNAATASDRGLEDTEVTLEDLPATEPGAEGGTETVLQASINETDGDFIRDLVRNASPNTHGQLAFSSAESSSLEAIRRSLARSSRFDIIDHRSWIQPINAEATPVMIQAGQRYDDRYEIEGTLSVSRSRYLHVQTDLWYTIFEPRGGTKNPYVQGFESSLSEEQLSEYQALVDIERQRGQYYAARSHVMTQSRRMRSDELHYIDHPLFGLVVRINRFSPESESP